MEVRFRLFFDSELSPLERENQAIQTRKILEKRLELAKVRAASVDLEGDEGVRIKFFGKNEEEIQHVLALFRYRGQLELKIVGSAQLHRKLSEEGKGYPAPPPDGYEWIANSGGHQDSERPFLKDEYILVRRDPIVTERNIVTAEPTPYTKGVAFTLDEPGSKALNEAAATLYHSIPNGMIAFLMDGQPKAMPRVATPFFGGTGEIAGFFEFEVQAVASIIRAGRLPTQIGTIRGGKPRYGEPESRRFIVPQVK